MTPQAVETKIKDDSLAVVLLHLGLYPQNKKQSQECSHDAELMYQIVRG